MSSVDTILDIIDDFNRDEKKRYNKINTDNMSYSTLKNAVRNIIHKNRLQKSELSTPTSAMDDAINQVTEYIENCKLYGSDFHTNNNYLESVKAKKKLHRHA